MYQIVVMGKPTKPIMLKFITNGTNPHSSVPIKLRIDMSKITPIITFAVLYILVLCKNIPKRNHPTHPLDKFMIVALSASNGE